MDIVFRAAIIYLFLTMIFAVAGKRSLAQIDTFDFVLLLIIGESTQQALIGNDFSISTAIILIATLVGLEILTSSLGHRWNIIEQITTGSPLVLVHNGKVLKHRCKKEKIRESDILAAAREKQGLERMDQIKFAVLEENGSISIIPASS